MNDLEKPDFPTISDMIIVSVGTGEVLKPYDFEKFENAGKIRWISPLIDILLSANAETVDYHLTKMYETLSKRNSRNYYRLLPKLHKASPEMDNVTPKNIYELIQAGLAFVDQNRDMLNDIARKLIKNV